MFGITILLSLLLLHHPSRLIENGMTRDRVLQTGAAMMTTLLSSSGLLVDASPPIEIAKKLKEKIRKGRNLLEDLTELLEHVKKDLKTGNNINKDVVNKLVDLKEQFKKLEVDPGDLPIELIERFKQKTLEAFTLILTSFNLDRIPEVQNLGNRLQEKLQKPEKSHKKAEVKEFSKPARDL